MFRPFVVAAALYLLLVAPASANKAWDTGVKAYYRGNMTVARQTFESAVEQDPTSALAHYYLANVYSRQRLYAAAASHYTTAKSLTRKPQMQEYCDAAINKLETLELTKDYYSKAAQHANKLASKLAANLDAEQRMKQQMIAKLSTDYMAEARNHAARIRADADYEVASLSRGRRGGAIRAAMINDIQADAKRREQQTLEWGQQRAANYRKQAQAQLDAYRESATNLTALMAAPLNRNGFGLSPYGTNLYVRNYTRP